MVEVLNYTEPTKKENGKRLFSSLHLAVRDVGVGVSNMWVPEYKSSGG